MVNFIQIFFLQNFIHRSRSRSPVRSRSPTQREWKRVRRDSSGGGGGGGDRNRSQRRDDNVKVRLYVSNIPYEVRWQDLKDIFKQQCKCACTDVVDAFVCFSFLIFHLLTQ